MTRDTLSGTMEFCELGGDPKMKDEPCDLFRPGVLHPCRECSRYSRLGNLRGIGEYGTCLKAKHAGNIRDDRVYCVYFEEAGE